MHRLLLLLIPLLLTGCGVLWDAGLSIRCGNSEECATEGKCGVRTWRAGDLGWRCVVESAMDCAESDACQERGACGYDPWVNPRACIATEAAHCRYSAACLRDGLCGLDHEGQCVPSEQGCRASEVCRDDERCAPVNDRACGRAWADAVSWCDAPCELEGACERQELECRAVSEADCQASRACVEQGRCNLDERLESCVVDRPEDCQGANICQEGLADGSKLCVQHEGLCADALSACAREPHCTIRGDCFPMEGTCAPMDGSCTETIDCEVQGRCQHENHLCLPMEPEHCSESLACEAFGRCELGTWLVQQCHDGSGVYGPAYGCAAEPCLYEGRCLQDATGVCHTPEELGLEDTLPRRRAPREPEASEPLPAVEGRGLRASLDRQELTFTHALTATRGGQGRWVLLADGPVDCAQLEVASPPEELSWVHASLAPGLGSKRHPGVTRAAWGLAGQGGSANGNGDVGVGVVAGGRVAFHVDYRLMSSWLWLDGAMDVHDCGDLDPVTRPRPQEGLEVELEGERVPVAMAIVDTLFEEPVLVLASQPVTCSWRHWQRGEPDLFVIVHADGDAEVEGARVAGSRGVFGRGEPLEFGEAGPNDELDVAVRFDPERSNPSLRVVGTARAVDCRD